MLFVLSFQEDFSVMFIYSVEFIGELCCHIVEIINTTTGRINTVRRLGACSRAFRRVTQSLCMEPMFSSSVPSLLERFKV